MLVCPSQLQVGGRLALPGGRVQVGGQAAHRLASGTAALRVSARPMVIGLPDRLASTVAPASASPLDGGTGTNMSSQISTPTVSPRTSAAREQQIGAERRALARRR